MTGLRALRLQWPVVDLVVAAVHAFEVVDPGQFTDGFRRVPIDPKFASTVDLSGQYHVVITPLAEALLYVTNRTPESFDVKAIPFKDKDDKYAPPEPIRFTWWVIGRRKDIKGPRFEEVKVPTQPKLP